MNLLRESPLKERLRMCSDCAYNEFGWYDRPCKKYCINQSMWVDELSSNGQKIIGRYKNNMHKGGIE